MTGTLIYFGVVLAVICLAIAVIGTIAYLIDLAHGWWQRRLLDHDLRYCSKRDLALQALADLARSGHAPHASTDQCRLCSGRVLPENGYGGICGDCWTAYDSATLEPDHTGSDAEWADLMRAIDDARLDVEDHR